MRRFMGGPWDGETFDVPDRREFTVLMQTMPYLAGEPERPFRYGAYRKTTVGDETVYEWKGLIQDGH
jgi:hypothetical protein